jgi:DnaJ-domain-containing protein 1
MGIWERLGNVLKSYINDGAERIFGEDRPVRHHEDGDDDYEAAYNELNDFLKGDTPKGREKPRDEYNNARSVPLELRADFAALGLSPGASKEECKEAYKKLLKIHHPDRYGRDPEAFKKATEKTSRINAAYDSLEKWFKTNL